MYSNDQSIGNQTDHPQSETCRIEYVMADVVEGCSN